MRPLLIQNARLIDPMTDLDAPGALLVEDGKIAGLAKGAAQGMPGGAEIIDAGGLILAPGLIDARVFVGEPGAEHKETLASASAAAAAGGITTIIVMPNTEPVIDDAALVDFVARRARDTAIVRVHPMAALTRGTNGEVMSEMGLLKEAGAIAFTDGDRPVANARVMRRAMAYATLFEALVVHHTEEPALSEGTQMNEGELATRLGLAGAPKAGETIMLERDIALVRLTGARYHAAAITCAESLAILARAKNDGLDVTAAAAAHHLLLNENDIGPYRTFLKVRPPLRAEADRVSLIEAMAAGHLDLVVSSHQPQGAEDKRLPFAEAADGAAGLETLLPALLRLVANGSLTLLQALRPVTAGPARRLRLAGGRLTPGAPADLVLIDPTTPYRVRLQDMRSKCRNSPFEGTRFEGRALRTIVGGRTVFAV